MWVIFAFVSFHTLETSICRTVQNVKLLFSPVLLVGFLTESYTPCFLMKQHPGGLPLLGGTRDLGMHLSRSPPPRSARWLFCLRYPAMGFTFLLSPTVLFNTCFWHSLTCFVFTAFWNGSGEAIITNANIFLALRWYRYSSKNFTWIYTLSPYNILARYI